MKQQLHNMLEAGLRLVAKSWLNRWELLPEEAVHVQNSSLFEDGFGQLHERPGMKLMHLDVRKAARYTQFD